MQLTQYRRFICWIGVLALSSFGVSFLYAQAPPGTKSETGLTASELFSGSSNSVSGMLNFDQSVGWNFTPGLGVDVGVPYSLVTRPGIFESTNGYQG